MNISRTVCRSRGGREGGYVAVELALILMALGGILTLTFSYGRAFWQYSAVNNAAYGATRYLAASGQWAALGSGSARRAATVEMFTTLAAASGLDVDPVNLDPVASCPSACNGANFDRVSLEVGVRLADPFGVWPADSWLGARSVAVNPN